MSEAASKRTERCPHCGTRNIIPAYLEGGCEYRACPMPQKAAAVGEAPSMMETK